MVELHVVQDAFRKGPHRMVELGADGALAYWSFGQGPDVVFIHGWPLHGATWRRLIPTLSEHFTCHVFDMPGIHHSRSWRGPIGMWEHTYTLQRAFEQLGLEQFAMVAHDSGGSIARMIAAEIPDRVSAIVLGNTEIPGVDLAGVDRMQRAIELPAVRPLMQMFMRSERVLRSKYGFASCFGDVSQLDTDFGEFFVKPLGHDRAYFDSQMTLVQNLNWNVVVEDLGPVHEKITAPVMLIWGERDPWFKWRLAKEMVDSFGSGPARVETFPTGKLFVHEEFAAQFAAWTLEFLLAPPKTRLQS